MHCEDPGCLRACPADGAIIKYENGIVDFQQENCIGCGYCISGCPFDIPKFNREDEEGLQVHALFGSRRRGARARLHQGVSDRLSALRHEGGDEAARRDSRETTARAIGLSECGCLRSAVDRRHPRHLCAARHHATGAVRRPAGESADSASYTVWKWLAKPIGLFLALMAAPVAFFHYVMEGPKEPASTPRGHGESTPGPEVRR